MPNRFVVGEIVHADSGAVKRRPEPAGSTTALTDEQAILLTGYRAPESARPRDRETATSIGVLLAQAGFAAGATVGGLSIDTLGIHTIPLVALVFVLASIATGLRAAIQMPSTPAQPALERGLMIAQSRRTPRCSQGSPSAGKRVHD